MSDLKISGKITKVSDRIKKTDKFTMRLFVIETDGQYPQPVKFQLVNDRCDLINNEMVGETITVHFDIRGNEWEGKIINNLNAWKIDRPLLFEAKKLEEPANDLPMDDGLPF